MVRRNSKALEWYVAKRQTGTHGDWSLLFIENQRQKKDDVLSHNMLYNHCIVSTRICGVPHQDTK